MSKLRAFVTAVRELPPVFRVCGVLALLGFVMTWTAGLWWLGSLISVGALFYVNGWVRGFKKGGDTLQAIYVDGHVEAMEKVVERVNEEYAPDSPERIAAHKQLTDLRRVQREIER